MHKHGSLYTLVVSSPAGVGVPGVGAPLSDFAQLADRLLARHRAVHAGKRVDHKPLCELKTLAQSYFDLPF